MQPILKLIAGIIVVAVLLWGIMQFPLDATLKAVIRVIAIVAVVIWAVYVLYPLASAALR
jgi:hypothetical protein